MTINIKDINKEVFKRVLIEENERADMSCIMFKEQIEKGNTYGDPEGFQKTYDFLVNKKRYFKYLISLINATNNINVSEEEKKYFNFLIENQIHVSNSRIKDWEKGGEMYIKLYYKNVTIGGHPEEEFDQCVKEIIKYDEQNIECVNKLKKLIYG